MAFDGVSRGDGVTLHEAVFLDYASSSGDERRTQARQCDTESRWQDVPAHDIARNSSVLAFLDTDGFHYYLPAYMVWFLRFMDVEGENSATFDALLFHLTRWATDNPFGISPKSVVQMNRECLERFERLTPNQAKAVAHFLRFVAAWEDKIQEEDERKIWERQTERDKDEGNLTFTEWRTLLHAHPGYAAFLSQPSARQALKSHWERFL